MRKTLFFALLILFSAMALALAGMKAEGETVISTAESVNVTFPGFAEKMKALGADIEEVE